MEPEEDRKWDAEHDREAGEERVPAALPELVVQLLPEEREREREQRAEDGGGGRRARAVREGVDEVELDGEATPYTGDRERGVSET